MTDGGLDIEFDTPMTWGRGRTARPLDINPKKRFGTLSSAYHLPKDMDDLP